MSPMRIPDCVKDVCMCGLWFFESVCVKQLDRWMIFKCLWSHLVGYRFLETKRLTKSFELVKVYIQLILCCLLSNQVVQQIDYFLSACLCLSLYPKLAGPSKGINRIYIISLLIISLGTTLQVRCVLPSC